ncbi:hypothetical protein ACXET9_06380 [Brachybacterium sp. DNPG3]
MTSTVDATASRPEPAPARRALLAAAAWSAPVLVVATAAPAMAASPTDLAGVTVYSGGTIDSNDDQSIWTLDWSLNFSTGEWPSTTDIPAGTVTVTVTIPDGNTMTVAYSTFKNQWYPWTVDWTEGQNVATFTNATAWPANTWTIQTDDITVEVRSTTDGAPADPPVATITPDSVEKRGGGWEAVV